MTDILALAQFTAEEKHREALRELAMRKTVFDRRVADGKMSSKDAERKIAIMAEIARDYAELVEKERLI